MDLRAPVGSNVEEQIAYLTAQGLSPADIEAARQHLLAGKLLNTDAQGNPVIVNGAPSYINQYAYVPNSDADGLVIDIGGAAGTQDQTTLKTLGGKAEQLAVELNYWIDTYGTAAEVIVRGVKFAVTTVTTGPAGTVLQATVEQAVSTASEELLGPYVEEGISKAAGFLQGQDATLTHGEAMALASLGVITVGFVLGGAAAAKKVSGVAKTIITRMQVERRLPSGWTVINDGVGPNRPVLPSGYTWVQDADGTAVVAHVDGTITHPGSSAYDDLVKRGNAGATFALHPIDQPIDLVGFRRDHIMNRHGPGTGVSGKTEFPSSWDEQRILHNISDVATDPASRRVSSTHGTQVYGVRDGVEIRVDLYPDNHPRYPGQISTGFPVAGPSVPVNP
ncbi:EndoU domain-containing protein [Rhodospirillum sp. A1_3_36]|uniref:EndoU domain-containing protein n=1 Tax=Rhodospirillum sp. A1_3_36 TaxID=3391666 RepID=UPI0039A5BA49